MGSCGIGTRYQVDDRTFGGSELSKMKKRRAYSSGMVVSNMLVFKFVVSYLNSGQAAG